MELSPTFYRFFVRPKYISKLIINHLLGVINFTNSTVLDFGCGIGTNSFLFPSSGYIGLDCNCSRINYAKKHYPDHKFISSANHHIPLPNKSVDYIIIVSVLHHISNKELKMYFNEFHRILKDNGKILTLEPCLFHNAHINNWFMLHIDKGHYIRKEKEYLSLFRTSNFHATVIKRYNQLILYNKIFISATPK